MHTANLTAEVHSATYDNANKCVLYCKQAGAS